MVLIGLRSCTLLLNALREADLVIGARWVPGGEVRELAQVA